MCQQNRWSSGYGSHGAQAITQAMTAAMPDLSREIPGLRVIHQTGEGDYNGVPAAYARAGVSAEVSVSPFIDDMPSAFAQADLLVCRSGASTVAEATAAGKPAIFVPFPRAADDHQRRNAEAIVEGGAAVLIAQSDLDMVWLVETVSSLLKDAGRLRRMGDAARKLSHPNAARDIAELAARLAGIE